MPEVVIIGAGVMGASVAAHLHALGIRDVLVVDRGAELGAGSTSRATGGFRAQFATEVNVRLSLLSREELRARPEFGYRPYGYLFLARDRVRAAGIARRAARPARVRPARSADDRRPRSEGDQSGDRRSADHRRRVLSDRRLHRADGESFAATRAICVSNSTSTCSDCATAGDRVIALQTSRGEIAGDVFVNAAGAWAAAFGDVPVEPVERHVVPTVPTGVLPEHDADDDLGRRRISSSRPRRPRAPPLAGERRRGAGARNGFRCCAMWPSTAPPHGRASTRCRPIITRSSGAPSRSRISFWRTARQDMA